MDTDRRPEISADTWNYSLEEIVSELKAFVTEFKSFTPEWFIELKFHLLRDTGLTKESQVELCSISEYAGTCAKCDRLYEVKYCPLWYRLYKTIRWRNVQRAPPCIRAAYLKKRITTVASFLSRTCLIDPPFFKPKGVPYCTTMDKWGYCEPDEYCKMMHTGSPLEYAGVRHTAKKQTSSRS